MAANDPKDTIYVDVDDEITTVIDKVLDSNKKLLALVLPKRASVFQSIVNMKLLKRKSDEAGKNIVLVTAEEGLLPLAGAVGIHVAKNLASKPEIPAAPVISQAMVEASEDEVIPNIDEATGEGSVDLKKMANEPVGKLAEDTSATVPSKSKEPDTIELDNTSDSEKPTDTAMPAAAVSGAAAADKAKKKGKKDKSLKVPNFEKFRLLAILGVLAIVILVVLWFLLFKVWPHATIDIKTNAQNVSANVTFNLDTNSSTLNTSDNSVPAKEVTETKTYTGTTNATGQQNNGQQATGDIQVSAGPCGPNVPSNIPAGTGTSANNLTFIIQDGITFIATTSHSKCTFEGVDASTGSSNIPITAQNGGSSYNVSNASFTFPGYSGITGSGSASGGTDDIVTVVTQQDISNAENNISPNTSGAKSDLTSQLNQANFYPLNATFTAGTPAITPNASAGTAASSVTVTENIKYTMYGVIESDLNTLLNNNIHSQVGSNQSILSNGLSSASYSIGSNPTNITLAANAIVGPDINITNLKKEIAGQKVASIQSIVKSNQNVSNVSVKFSPFYVSTAPGVSHITINIAKPTNSTSNASSQ